MGKQTNYYGGYLKAAEKLQKQKVALCLQSLWNILDKKKGTGPLVRKTSEHQDSNDTWGFTLPAS